jgi:hypothetical protein
MAPPALQCCRGPAGGHKLVPKPLLSVKQPYTSFDLKYILAVCIIIFNNEHYFFYGSLLVTIHNFFLILSNVMSAHPSPKNYQSIVFFAKYNNHTHSIIFSFRYIKKNN